MPNHDYYYEVDPSIRGGIVEMLLYIWNTSLQQIEDLQFQSVDHQHQINRLLLLNRYGQDFVSNPKSVPMEHWGDALRHIGTSDCNCFVTELVRRAVEGQVH